MGNGFLDRVEDNAVVRTWAEITQREKGDSLVEGYISELWDFTRVRVTQNNLQELKEIWNQWNNEVRQLFYSNYGDLPYLLDIKVDKRLFRALAQFWNPAYSCFTFGRFDLVPTIEEYTTLLRCSRIQVDKVYSKAVNALTFLKRLVNITGMSEQWVKARIKQKGDSKCIPWKNLKDLLQAHPDMEKKVNIFALSIYGMVVFPRALGHIDEAVTDLFDRLDKRITLIAVILAKTFRSLNACWRAGESRFIGCAQLLLAWSRQFVPATHGLVEYEFSYKGEGYKRRIREMVSAWGQTRRMKRLVVGPMTTPKYSEWWVRRINDNIPGSRSENSQSIEEYLRVVPTELEIIKQDFEKKNIELEKKIEQLEEGNVNLRLDADVQKLKADKLRKWKNKAEEDLDSLKTDYKKLRLSMRTAGLRKTSEQ
ncbi:hypothetical protein Gogos_021994 [Gossypium gossypioides]|uniref:DUF7745 domain-containing protein n=1 Tax=Gossypium gossypioides TaxID=34282 RepID=A0A7J9D6Y9_GOSGO|nr:hypothetical protein [Gossypium gossypioides]